MNFAYPWILLLLLLIPFLWRTCSVKSIAVPSLSHWPQHPKGRHRYLWLLTTCKVLSLIALIIALARPQSDRSQHQRVAQGIAIELAIDISSSMDFNFSQGDTSQTRMETAKTVVERFITGDGDQLSGRPHDMIGLITFARYADTRSPLTFGHKALVQIIRNLEVESRANEDATSYGDALALACARLKYLDDLSEDEPSSQANIASRVVILLTDGENNSGSHLPLEAAALAKKWDCRVYVISMSETWQENTLTDSSGQQVATAPVTSEADLILQRIAEDTGGLFRKATDPDSVYAVYQEIDQLETTRMEQISYATIGEWFWLPLLLCLICQLLLLLLQSTLLRIYPNN